jgi:methionine synthase II (cobalamin-independent)
MAMDERTFDAVATVVGSFPHRDASTLVERIFERLPEMPVWPQLPGRDWRESMYVQYAEGLPGAVLDSQTQRLYFQADDRFEADLERFYEAVVTENVEAFAISEGHALGLHRFLARALRERPRFVKGQVTGPFSFAMTVTDESRRSLAYTPALQEVAVQGLAMKARWMARQLRSVAPGALVVLDEPYLCAFGSAFVNVSREDVVAAIDTAVEAIHEEKALAGLHCCGNTDWSLVLETKVDVVNFDAFEYFQGLSLYPSELGAFLDRGGALSWGIVPTSAAIDDVDAHALKARLEERIAVLAGKGLDETRLRRQALLTPSCGMGTQTEAAADRVFDALVELARLVRDGQ